MRISRRKHCFNFLSGFTLIELTVVLIIFSLLATGLLSTFNALRLKQRYTETTGNLEKVDLAFSNYVTLQGRLPCPADGTLASTNASAGVETARSATTGCTTTQLDGVIPWRVLGLSEADVSDGWYRRFTYRVPNNLTIDNSMNLSACDPSGTAGLSASGTCMPGCSMLSPGNCTQPSTYLAGKGLTIQNVAGTLLQDPTGLPSTGAAYVVISHGSTGGGSYNDSGVLLVSTIEGTQETLNKNNRALAATYIRDGIIETPAASHYDDHISSPAVSAVVARAQTASRMHP